jgi:hypothetical protein
MEKNGTRLLVIIAIAGAAAIGGAYTLGFTHTHNEYVTEREMVDMKIQLARIEVKLDLMLEAHAVTFADTTAPVER